MKFGIFIIFPIVILLAMVGKSEWNQRNGEMWEINISGYDPRDILRGQYILFRYDWNIKKNMCKGDDCIICIKEGANVKNPAIDIIPSEKARECKSYIKGQNKERFRIGDQRGNYLERYYVPEDKAKWYEDILRKTPTARMRLMVDNNGNAYIKKILLD